MVGLDAVLAHGILPTRRACEIQAHPLALSAYGTGNCKAYGRVKETGTVQRCVPV